MIFIYILLFIFLCVDCKPVFKFSEINETYLSKENSTIIKGIFVILVFLRHWKTYLQIEPNFLDKLFYLFDGLLGQLIVSMFLFYSGYGIFESYKKKGHKYIIDFIPHRFFPTYLNFSICIIFYLILSFIIKQNYSISQILLSFTGWKSVGNSNWYMFVTFSLYILFFVSFIYKSNDLFNLILFSVLVILFSIFLYIYKPSYWYNTLFCFLIGFWWSYKKDTIKIYFLSNSKYYLTLVSLFCLFCALYLLARKIPHVYIFVSCIFSIMFALLTMKLYFKGSVVFAFLGNHVFSIYILQRLFLIIYSHLGLNKNIYFFLLLSFVSTVIFSFFYDFIFNFFRSKISK